MSCTKKVFLILSIFSLIMIVYFIFSLEYKVSLKSIKRKFDNNEELFLNSVNELMRKDKIVLEKKMLHFKLIEYGDYPGSKNTKNIGYSNSEYSSTLKIMRNVRIKKVTKFSSNIIYVINSNAHIVQSISYIDNMDDFEKSHVIKNIILIKDNWYYVEEE